MKEYNQIMKTKVDLKWLRYIHQRVNQGSADKDEI